MPRTLLSGTALRRTVPKEMFPVVKDAMEEGWVPYVDGKNHLRLEHPEYGCVSNGLTPTSPANEAKNLRHDIITATVLHMDRKEARRVAEHVDKTREEAGEETTIPCWACMQEGAERTRTFISMQGLMAHIRKDHRDILSGKVEDIEEEETHVTLEDKVREAMETFQGESLTTDDLIRLTDLDRKQVQNTMVRLVDDPDVPVKRKKRGVYIYQPKPAPKMKAETKPEETPVPETETAKDIDFDAMSEQVTSAGRQGRGMVQTSGSDAPETDTRPDWTVVMEGKDGSLMLKAHDGSFWKAERL